MTNSGSRRRLTVGMSMALVGGILLSAYIASPFSSHQTSASPRPGLVPMLWESTNFNMSNGETALQAATQFKANFIFRGTFQWGVGGVQGGPESTTHLFLKTSKGITLLKQSNPYLLFEGGFAAQYLPRNVTWANGTAISDAAFGAMVGKNASGGWVSTGYGGFVPDLASPTYRTYVLQWSERQVDEGVDGILFDEPYAYASYLVSVEQKSPAVVYSEYGAYLGNIVESLKSYASAHGRTFFATINSGQCDAMQWQLQNPQLISFVSYVTCSLDPSDLNPSTNPDLQPVENFTELKASITAVVDVPLMVFVDWPTQQDALSSLTTEQQILALTNLDHQLKANGLSFVYEVYHHEPVYDSATEGIYSAMLHLANDAAGNT